LISFDCFCFVFSLGDADLSVPIQVSRDFAYALAEAGVRVEMRSCVGASHTDFIIEDPIRGHDHMCHDLLTLIFGQTKGHGEGKGQSFRQISGLESTSESESEYDSDSSDTDTDNRHGNRKIGSVKNPQLRSSAFDFQPLHTYRTSKHTEIYTPKSGPYALQFVNGGPKADPQGAKHFKIGVEMTHLDTSSVTFNARPYLHPLLIKAAKLVNPF